MAFYSYPDIEEHAKEHSKLIDEVVSLKQDFESDELDMDVEFVNFLQAWIADHIITEDKKLGTYLNTRSTY